MKPKKEKKPKKRKEKRKIEKTNEKVKKNYLKQKRKKILLPLVSFLNFLFSSPSPLKKIKSFPSPLPPTPSLLSLGFHFFPSFLLILCKENKKPKFSLLFHLSSSVFF